MIADDSFSADDEDFFGEDISWEDAAEDLEKQKEMILTEGPADIGGGDAGGFPVVDSAGSAPVHDQLPDADLAGVDSGRLGILLDINMAITVELGRSKMLINDLLQLGQGSVIELSKLIGEPLDILINDSVIAKGEVVVVNEKFGVRLTEVTSKTKRIEQMG